MDKYKIALKEVEEKIGVAIKGIRDGSLEPFLDNKDRAINKLDKIKKYIESDIGKIKELEKSIQKTFKNPKRFCILDFIEEINYREEWIKIYEEDVAIYCSKKVKFGKIREILEDLKNYVLGKTYENIVENYLKNQKIVRVANEEIIKRELENFSKILTP